MASSYTASKNFEKQATGENDNTWGDRLNDTLDLIDKAVAGVLSKSVAGAVDVTLSAAEATNLIHQYTGALTGSINVVVPTASAFYVIYNNTSGSYTLTVKTSGGTGIAVTQGKKRFLYCDGTNVVNAATEGFLTAVSDDTSPSLGGALSANSHIVKLSKGADIASAGALTVTTDGNFFNVTGTTTVTSINTVAIGTTVTFCFSGALTLTHHATNLILPSGANITTAANDVATFTEYGTGTWRCVNYIRASGLPIVPAAGGDFMADGTVPMTGSLVLGGAGTGIVFEGTTADAFETTLVAGEPTADRTVTMPDATTTLAGLGVAQTFTAKQTVNADLETSGDLILTGAGKGVIFEGTTADAFETTLVAGEPTADRTVTMPNATTTLAGLAVAQTFTLPQVADTNALTHNTAWDATAIQHATVTVNGSSFTIANPSAQTNKAFYAIYVSYTTTHSISWGTNFKGVSAITPTATAGKHDVFFFRSDGTNLECVGYKLDIGA